MVVDTHCHLTLRFEPDELAGVLHNAVDAGVEGVLLVGYCPVHYRRTADILDQFGSGGGSLPALAGTIGIHPHEADNYGPSDIEFFGGELERQDIVAIGETGLDFFRDYADRTRQEDLFNAQVALAAESGYPLVIHSRNAFDRTIEILENYDLPDKPGVFHCYGYGPDEIDKVTGMGFYVSFAGNLTYPKATELHSAARKAPEDRILTETDSPFLIPNKAKNRKVRRCEPANVIETAEKLSEFRGWTLEKTSNIVSVNTLNCFPLLRNIEPWAEIGRGVDA